jgi:hypothetical protein
MNVAPCSNCGGSDLRSTTTNAVGSFGPDLLPGASGWVIPATFDVVVCCNCGLVRFFAPPAAIEKVAKSASWERPLQVAHDRG